MKEMKFGIAHWSKAAFLETLRAANAKDYILRRGVTVTPRILVPVIPVRIGVAQQLALWRNWDTRKTQNFVP